MEMMDMPQENDPKIRVGIVGVGNWARYGHIPSLKLLPEYTITAVASRRLDTAVSIAAEFDIKHAVSDPSELVHHPEVDLVVVLPPAPEHSSLVRMAIAAGKDVHCEWPLTTTLKDAEDLLRTATTAGVRHIVGLQRRLGPSARYARDLLASGYVGDMRSVRLHVSMEYFTAQRAPALAWTIGPDSFSHIFAIYGGHFLDLMTQIVGFPKTVSAIVATQFPILTLTATGETFPNKTPDGVVALGTLENGALFSVQIEGGKLHGSGLQIDITGTQGDLRISNPKSFTNSLDNLVEGAKGDPGPLIALSVPDRYQLLPQTNLDVSVQDLANVYAAHAKDRIEGTHVAPDFGDAVRMHRLLDRIHEASRLGTAIAVA
jgi:predicted dehydrogenase